MRVTLLSFRKAAGAGAPGVITQDARVGYASSGTADPHNAGTINIGATANYVLAKVTSEGTQTIDGVSVGGEALSNIAGATRTNSQRQISFWGLANPTTGAGKAISVDLSGTENATCEVVTLIGVDTSSPIADSDTGAASTATTCTLDSSLTPDGTCWLEVGMCHGSNSTNATYGGSITTNTTRNANEHSGVYGFQADVTVGVQPSATWTGNEVAAMGAVLLRAA